MILAPPRGRARVLKQNTEVPVEKRIFIRGLIKSTKLKVSLRHFGSFMKRIQSAKVELRWENRQATEKSEVKFFEGFNVKSVKVHHLTPKVIIDTNKQSVK